MQQQFETTRATREIREAAYYDSLCTQPGTQEDIRIAARFASTREFIRVLGDCREKTILDLGCGCGLLSVNLALSLRPERIIGIDIAAKAVAQADDFARLCGVDHLCEFHVASAYSLPLPDASVDLVVGTAILHHLDKEEAARELARVLRPGGEVHLAENNGDNLLLSAIRALLYRFQWFQRESEDGHPLTRSEIAQFGRPFDRVEVTVPYVELFGTLAYGERPFSRFESALALIDRMLNNPLTRGFSMARWIHAVKAASERDCLSLNSPVDRPAMGLRGG